ncbi:MAG: hypothetical protein JWL70_2863 [Acidimicrobiia bacterium]|nr:hypothetical protein [Acidimicrobiia bacterium]
MVSMTNNTNTTTITTDFDLYREVHKGIRHALFHTTMQAGRVDPIDEAEVTGLLATHETLIELMTNHHHHEDDRIQPFIERHGGPLAATVLNDHHRIEGQMGELDLVAQKLGRAGSSERPSLARRFYLDLASLTSLYLTHQALEEEQVMPALRAALPVDELIEIEMGIRLAVAPDLMVRFMTHMIPAMNVYERSDMLAGMSVAPPEIFAGFRAAAEAALTTEEFAAVAARVGLN